VEWNLLYSTGEDMLTVPTDSLLTVTEVSDRLNLRPSTIRAWISKSKLAHLKLGRSVRVPESEVTRVIKESMVPAQAGVSTAPTEGSKNDVGGGPPEGDNPTVTAH
jgi:excisionase family DNA binding protein